MNQNSRHRCLLYRGAPSLQLPMLAGIIREKLQQNQRCLYLNSPSMVAGMRSYLAAADVDVASETLKGSLVVTSKRHHLVDGRSFSVNQLMDSLEKGLEEALDAGYEGLWATGDMTWELGPEVGSGKLLEYEWQLEQFMRTHPQLAGICQYHIDSLPMGAVRQGLSAHTEVFVNETLSLINPYYMSPWAHATVKAEPPKIDGFIHELCNRSVSA